MEHSKVTGAVIAGIVGLAVGVGGTWLAADMHYDKDMKNGSSMETTDDTKMGTSSDGITVGGAKMVRTLDIVDNAVNASNVTTLVSLVQKADLVDTLKSDGPFTVFGPTNDAFGKLPAATVESLLQPENKDALANILTYHVVAGTYTTADLTVMAKKGQSLVSVQGEKLTPVLKDNALYIKDANGGNSMIETADVISTNGVTHVVDSVLMPKN